MLGSVCFFSVFSGLAILSSFFVIFTKNPVFSVLFLIFTFANAACLLFLFNIEFLPIILLIVYVGAIAVLFLFILMMLNIKLASLHDSYSTLFFIVLIFFIIFVTEFLLFFRSEFVSLNVANNAFLMDFLSDKFSTINFDSLVLTNLKVISVALFNDYLYAFLLAGYILLLAMVSAIILTLQKAFINKSQNIYNQLMTNFNKTIVSYS